MPSRLNPLFPNRRRVSELLAPLLVRSVPVHEIAEAYKPVMNIESDDYRGCSECKRNEHRGYAVFSDTEVVGVVVLAL